MTDHNPIARHDAQWTFFATQDRMIFRGCMVCGEVEAVPIDRRAALQTSRPTQPGGR